MAYGASAQAWDAKRQPGDMGCEKMGVEKIYKGTMLYWNAAGFLCQIADVATGDSFAGVAAETVDNRYIVPGDSASGAATAGDRTIRYWRKGVFEFKHAGAARTDCGLMAYAQLGSADAGQTVKSSTDGTHAMMVGKIVGVSAEANATRVYVLIDGCTCLAAAETAVIGGWST